MTTVAAVTPGVDLEWLAQFGERYLAAWNSHEPDRLLALMSEDIVYDDTAWPTRMIGHDDVRAFLTTTWRAFPDLRFEQVEPPYFMHGAPNVAYRWRGTATFTGPLDPPGFAPTGRAIAFEGVDFHEYAGGRLTRLQIDFDLMDLSRQAGLMPARGSRAERAMAAVQRASQRARRRGRRRGR